MKSSLGRIWPRYLPQTDSTVSFRRASSITALGVTHLVAPSPQAKGKIERRFGTFQKRMLALLAYEPLPARVSYRQIEQFQGSKKRLFTTLGILPLPL